MKFLIITLRSDQLTEEIRELMKSRNVWRETAYLFCLFIYIFIAFYLAGFTVAQRERAQEDFNVPHEGAPPHPPPICIRKTATAPGSPYSFRIVRGFFYVPQNYQLTELMIRIHGLSIKILNSKSGSQSEQRRMNSSTITSKTTHGTQIVFGRRSGFTSLKDQSPQKSTAKRTRLWRILSIIFLR